MRIPLFLVALLASSAPVDDPREIVARLISPKSAERFAAERALEAMGDLALPALSEAAESLNLELRHRVAAIADALDGKRLARPTMVPLNYSAKPLHAVVSGIARDAGVNISIATDGDVRLRDRPVTLMSDSPVTLWGAVDQLSKAAGLRLDPPLPPGFAQQRAMFPNNPGRRRRIPSSQDWVLRADDSPLPPVSDTGAFRVSIAGLVLNRNRSFVRTAEAPQPPLATSLFQISLAIRAEPLLTIASVDPPIVTEAKDEKGRSLLVTAQPAVNVNRQPFGEPPGHIPMTISLGLPEEPGQTIASLKGTMRGLVVGRRKEFVRIPLEGAAGKTFSTGSDTIVVHLVRPEQGGRDTTIEVGIEGKVAGPGMQNGFGVGDIRAGLRPPPTARGQMEFYDAKGRLCQTLDLGALALGMGFNGRQTLLVQPIDGTGPATEARYYGPAWSTVEIPFHFRDIPMP